MNKVFRLQNQIKHYEWGSPFLLPHFLGKENLNGEPWAEMWMGTHKSAPSRVFYGDNPDHTEDLSHVSGGEIPFLFKLLAVDKPLSVQAHPNQEQAESGFKREEERGIPFDSPVRNYRDPVHKPEILCAVSPFTLMLGFRRPEQISEELYDLINISPPLEKALLPLLRALEAGHEEDAVKGFFRCLFEIPVNDRESICFFISEKEGGKIITEKQWQVMKSLASRYRGDAAVLSPLFLNIITLDSLQAIYIPSGVLHSHISGFAAELMANSDNVLRCGITNKHVDVAELINILDFNPFLPQPLSPDDYSPEVSETYRYPAPCGDFSLSFINCRGGKVTFCEYAPAICIVTEGSLETGGGHYVKGESFYIPPVGSSSPYEFNGNFAAFIAVAGEA